MTDDIAAPAAKARSLDAFLPAGERTDAHIVDRLIEERCPKLRASPAWPVARPLLYSLLGYGKARAMAAVPIPKLVPSSKAWVAPA